MRVHAGWQPAAQKRYMYLSYPFCTFYVLVRIPDTYHHHHHHNPYRNSNSKDFPIIVSYLFVYLTFSRFYHHTTFGDIGYQCDFATFECVQCRVYMLTVNRRKHTPATTDKTVAAINKIASQLLAHGSAYSHLALQGSWLEEIHLGANATRLIRVMIG